MFKPGARHHIQVARISGRSGFLKGQMLVLFTLILPVLLGVMALGADFSVIYFNWTMVQKAADAAALAGASQLTGQPGSASTVKPAVVNYVNGYACLNGISDPNNTYPTLCSPGGARPGFADKIVFTNVTDTQVSVGIKRSVPYFFGKMIGLQEASVAANATAAVNPVGTVSTGLFPVGIQCTALAVISAWIPVKPPHLDRSSWAASRPAIGTGSMLAREKAPAPSDQRYRAARQAVFRSAHYRFLTWQQRQFRPGEKRPFFQIGLLPGHHLRH